MPSRNTVITFLAAAGVVLFFVFTAPTRVVPHDGKLHLRYWMITGMKEIIPYYATSFNAMQDSIVVETTPIPWQEHEKKILTAVLSGDPPDVVNQVTPVAKWASRMALVALDDYIARDRFDTSAFFSSLWGEMKWQGHVFAIPVFSGSYALFYNRELFREAGLDPDRPPRTWDEVWQYNARLVKRDAKGQIVRMGFIPNYGNLMTSMLMAWELGAKFLSDDGKTVHLDDPAMVKGLEWTVKFYEAYPREDVAAFMAGFGFADQHGFIARKVAMMVLDSGFPDQIKLYRPNLDYGVAMIPSFEGCPTASASGSWWMAIPRGAKNPEAAWQFMKHAASKQAQLREVQMTEESLFPANKLAAADPEFINSRQREIFVAQMEYSHSPSIVPMAHDVFWREFLGAQERAIYGKQSPEEALKDGERVLQGILDEALAYDNYVRGQMTFPGVK
jgi:multiple sugar transport system substrate-binding protein